MAMKVPTEEEWGNWRADLDQQWAHKNFAGLTIDEAQQRFAHGSIIERVDEIRWMPMVPFRYYFAALAHYIAGGAILSNHEPATVADCFLSLLVEKIGREPHVIRPILPDLMPALEFLKVHPVKVIDFLETTIDYSSRAEEISQQIKTAFVQPKHR